MKNANAPALAPIVGMIPTKLIRPSTALVIPVPRSIKNLTSPELTNVFDSCSAELLNFSILPPILSRYLAFSTEALPTLSIACAVAFSAS